MTASRPKNTATGYNKEKQVVGWLERHGWNTIYEGGRGPADIIARSESSKWFIQVKYTRSHEMNFSRFSKELYPLIDNADGQKGTAVLCLVIQTSIWFCSAKTFKTLKRGFL